MALTSQRDREDRDRENIYFVFFIFHSTDYSHSPVLAESAFRESDTEGKVEDTVKEDFKDNEIGAK